MIRSPRYLHHFSNCITRMATTTDSFIRSKRDFATVSGSVKNVGKILVLDSSFNPPHLGHYALAHQALQANTGPALLVLLLLVKNADKLVPEKALFDERLEMMQIMAGALARSRGGAVDVAVALTTHARFVDKALAINSDSQIVGPDGRARDLTFLTGYDTLVRVLDQKYYTEKLEVALGQFMATSEIFCLTRSQDSDTEREQLEFVRAIADAKQAGVPPLWASRIHLVAPQPLDQSLLGGSESSTVPVGEISLSGIRAYVRENNWAHAPLLPEIREYIQQHCLYSSS